MAIDYLTALKDYATGGGKSIDEFLKQHTKPAGTVVQPAAAEVQPAGVAAQLAAADARERLGLGTSTAPGGNIITQNANRPVSAESDALAARIAARNAPGGVVVQPANAPAITAGAGFAPTPRRLAPAFAVGTTGSAGAAQPEVPWWQQSAFGKDKTFNTFVNQNEQGAKATGNGLVRINKNTFIPSSVNYNRTSDL